MVPTPIDEGPGRLESPERILAFSMGSLLLIGLLAQCLQRHSGMKRHLPLVLLALLLLVSIAGMINLQASLKTPEWRDSGISTS